MWTANAPALLVLLPCSCIAPGLLLACSQPAHGLLMACSYHAPGPGHPSLAAFIIISTLRLFFGTAIAAFYGTNCHFQTKRISQIESGEVRPTDELTHRESRRQFRTIRDNLGKRLRMFICTIPVPDVYVSNTGCIHFQYA